MLKAEALFGGSGNMLPQRNFENLCSKWGHLGLFYIIHNFFSPLKIQKRFETLWLDQRDSPLDKDIKNGELSIILLYPFVGSSSWQNTQRYEIYSSSIEQKSLLCRKSVWFFHAHLQLLSRHEPRECIKGPISQPRSLEVPSLHLFLQSLYM